MAQTSAEFLAIVIACIREADRHGPTSKKGSEVLDGLSGRKTVAVLRRLVGLFADDPDVCYLEIGVYQGLTLLSVAIEFPHVPCFGIDNFSVLDPDGKNLEIVKERTARLGVRNAVLINDDFEDALESLDRYLQGRKIAVYSIDGAHDYRSQFMALMLARPYLAENAVIVIDDANYAFVRRATRDFLLTHDHFRLLFEAYSPAHPANLDRATLVQYEEGWLNGIHVLAPDPDGLLLRMLPPAAADRGLYVNDWLVHRHQFAELAPEALALAQAVCIGDEAAETRCRDALRGRHKVVAERLAKLFADRNTYSDDLPETRFNRRE